MNGYVCFYNSKRIEVRAPNLWEAKQEAETQFQILERKRKVRSHMISVVLCERSDGSEVAQTLA